MKEGGIVCRLMLFAQPFDDDDDDDRKTFSAVDCNHSASNIPSFNCNKK